jgi:hypothetical protein
VALGGTVATVGFPDIGFNAKAQRSKDARQTLFILCALAPLRLCVDFSSGALPENVNYAVKSREGRHVAVPNLRDADTASLPFLKSVPAVSAKLKAPNTADEKFSDVVRSAQHAAVLVLVY